MLLRQFREEAVKRLLVVSVYGFFVFWVYVVAVQALTSTTLFTFIVPTKVLTFVFFILLVASTTFFHFQCTRSRATNPVPELIIANHGFQNWLNRAIFWKLPTRLSHCTLSTLKTWHQPRRLFQPLDLKKSPRLSVSLFPFFIKKYFGYIPCEAFWYVNPDCTGRYISLCWVAWFHICMCLIHWKEGGIF